MKAKFSEAAYEARIEGLFRRFQSVQTAGFGAGAYKPGLAGMLRFCDALGFFAQAAAEVAERVAAGPEGLAAEGAAQQPAGIALPYPCIHVAGTNGKGSVCSMLASALAAGRKVGLYTSPHLLDFRERMRVVTDDGWYLPSKEWVWNFLEEYEDVFNGSTDASATAPHLPPLSFFEITTGMAFKWFAEQGVDCAVIEVGLGGRLDSTNVIRPSLCVITSIGLDHCAILGGTRAEIAAEKAGIFKPGVPAVVWGRDPETAPVFERIADSVGSPLIFAEDNAEDSAEVRILAEMDLKGPCQRQNLHTALAALAVLSAGQNGASPHIHISEATAEALKQTASRTGFRGRWEKFFVPLKPKDGAAPSIAEVICDIGHNPPALAINFARLKEISHRPLAIVYGVMADKDLAGIAPMMPAEARYFLVAPDSPRALPAGELLARLKALRPDLSLTVAGSGSVAEGVAAALAGSGSVVYIGGSTFVVAEAIPLLERLGTILAKPAPRPDRTL